MGRLRWRPWEGRVSTPPSLARFMVGKLFEGRPPPRGARVLDAGAGTGVFVDAVLEAAGGAVRVVGVELDPRLASMLRKKYAGDPRVWVVEGDFLALSAGELGGPFDYVIGNPPYVSYERIPAELRLAYRRLFSVARGRFDLYMLFFEKALSLLKPGGRLVFVTPEKYVYTLSAAGLRRLLARYNVRELIFLDEDAFPGVLAYPLITVVDKEPYRGETLVTLRDGARRRVALPVNGASWLPAIQGRPSPAPTGPVLASVAERISPGVATGRDEVYVIPRSLLPPELEPYAYPTVGGADLARLDPSKPIDPAATEKVILVPYDSSGRLLSEDEASP